MSMATTKKNNSKAETSSAALGAARAAASAPPKAAAGAPRGGLRRTPSKEEIATRAYELYLERGCTDGHADEDWAEAERDLSANKN
ncbi:MAG: DUF2934 domain-containing protein [Proteobacteria bacterium]|nr:DUF2934 domain-containing protein [Pseudomonadota bacterium]